MTDPHHDQPERADASAALEAADLWRCDLVTRSGLVLRIRPVRPEDEAALSDFFSRLAPADLRFRFLGGVREVSHERLVAMTRVDHRATEHFLAFAEDGGTIIAAAMVACDPLTKKAEVAISVRAEDKHKGVAWEMLRHAARYAQARGAEALESLESRENREAIELEQEQGFLAFPYPDDPTLILIRKDLRLP
ncbi:MAG: GNAT family N-acetyltransferase [Shinella zoogloeoides]|uniref:GNAT family N-acetyltransferase n=1 Tax=Shinella zoogloeoides TaxID=352475 RepID=UPI003C7706C1